MTQKTQLAPVSLASSPIKDVPLASRWRLFWLALALVVFTGGLLALSLNFQRVQAIDAGKRLTGSYAQVIEEQTTRTIQTVDQQLQLASRALADLKIAGTLNEQTARLVLGENSKSVPFVRAIWVLDAQGRILYDADEGNIGISLQDRPYFQIYLSAPETGFHLGAPVRSRSTGTWLVSASRPLKKADGSFDGIIVAAVEPPYFDKLWRNIDLGPGGSISLLSRSGVMMIRTPMNDDVMGKSFQDRPVFKTLLPESPTGSYEDASAIDGTVRLFAYRTLSEHPDFVVAVGQSRDFVLTEWRQLATVAWLVWFAAAVAVILLSLVLDRVWRQRAHAQMLSEQAAQRLALATEAASIGVWEWDIAADRWEATPTYFTLLGDAVGNRFANIAGWLERVHPDDRDHVGSTLAAVIAGEVNEFHYEARFRHVNGHYRWMDVAGRALAHDDHGKATRLLGARVDITERKEAQEARSHVLERVTNAFMSFDKDWRCTYVNQNAADILGHQASWFMGKQFWDEYPQLVGLEFHQACLQAMSEQKPLEIATYFAPEDRWFENHMYPSPDGLTLYFQDITTRKQAEQAMRDSEARYRALFESNPHPMWVYDLETLAFLAVNDAAIAHYGYSRAEFLGMTIRDIRPAEDVAPLLADVASVNSSLSTASVWRHLRKDGSVILVEITAHSLNFGDRQARLIHAHDVTARQRAEEKLRLNEENLSITLNSIGDAVIATDASGLIARMNPTAERLTGWSLVEALGKPLREVFRIINAQSRAPAIDPVQQVMASGQVVGLANHTALLARDGQEYQIFDSAAPMRDASGDIIGVVLVFSDVTEAYRINQALAATTSLLERTGEMAKIGGWEYDLRTQKLKLTKEARRLIGAASDGEPSADDELSAYSEDSRAVLVKAMQTAMATGEAFDLELSRSIQGQTVWVRTQGSVVFENGQAVRLWGASQDITERKLAEESTRIAATAFETQQGMSITDAQCAILRVNRAFTRITGYSAEEVLGKNPRLLHSDRQDGAFYKTMWDSIGNHGFWQGEIWNKRKNGEIYPEWLSISAVKDDAGTVTHYVSEFTDISARKDAEQRIETLVFYDPLTGLPNRALLRDRLQHALAAATRRQRQAALLHIDLDDFKSINDTLGHDLGDQILEEVARRLRTCARASDTLARIGGDEFILLLEGASPDNLDPVHLARVVGEKVLLALRQPFALGESHHHSSASVGITLLGDTELDNVEEPLKQAELAMYQAKTAGRNTLRFFDPQMQAEVSARSGLESRLREALAKNQFVLHYQPQVDQAGQVTGAEALVRWLDPKRGMVSPAEFIPVAEQSGLILPLGQWVLETACHELARWAGDPALASLTVAVNVSARQFRQSTFVDEVLGTLKRTGANPKRLKLELTESMLVDDIAGVIAKMSALKGYGVNFSLDDFGTGYSSLVYLKSLPLDQLKIDQGFVRDILIDTNDAAIAKMVIALADTMGLAVIAEGVETEGQRAFLASAGCRAYQGYLFSRPLPIDAFEAFVNRV